VFLVDEYSILEDDFDEEPEVDVSSGSFGDINLVGHGDVGSSFCGKVVTLKGCLRVELHNRVTLDGKDFRGKVFVHRVRFSCGKPSCPVCFKHGWAVREAGNIERRLTENGKYGKGFGRWGMIEHIIVAVPPKFYGLSLEALRGKVVKILADRGVIGGCLIYHGFRYNLRKYWYFSPHFHVLGFIRGGYKCRGCAKVLETGKCGVENRNCDGFVNRSYRCYEKDDCIVKVKGKRKTVFGTAWYQLNHSSVKAGAVRFHVATWFGVCSYRKLKVTVEMNSRICPICKHDVIDIRYFGCKPLSLDGEVDSFEDYEENGRPVFVERVNLRYGSGSYEE
jgi:hypothetical protein